MRFGIIGAMDEELGLLLKEMTIEKQETKANMKFSFGMLWNKEVVAVRCGIGKVNAAVCAQILIDDFKVNRIINVGIAGGVHENVLPGDVVIADNLIQHDMDTSAFGDPIGQIPRLDTFDFKCDEELVSVAKRVCEDTSDYKCLIGRIVTGDQFIGDIEKVKWLHSKFKALACEMEGGSIAQVCYLNNIPFVVIRSISDNASIGAHMEYEKFMDIAIKNSSNILKGMLLNC
ncbi:5'-methylthioadenosine/adenosylhomocysteine nucleosidase [Clostridium niameyense]|uniref:adenosylhomocysteine nucleosidase n=1 Tax=Clostridium niameyense TaxID=1622073 RepID=A0A6M0R7Z9_9CLOT|nr:5'-methylthioadenosine/adenosylhomocysteine nucleosidase [Clostridium niameyense]NEZ46361.1 5'-methylthioadenosine/adenosylhomocysteine nucleosidase [Clostridium niameyense]